MPWTFRQTWSLRCHFSCSTSYIGNSGFSPANLISDFIIQRHPEHRSHHSALSDLDFMDQPDRQCSRLWTSQTDSVHVSASQENEDRFDIFCFKMLVVRIIFLCKGNFNLLLLYFSMNYLRIQKSVSVV